jgi:uncharacterized protein
VKRASGAAACPCCGKPAGPAPENLWRPFCSERCKMADLGQWFAGRYAIPEEEPEPPAGRPQ